MFARCFILTVAALLVVGSAFASQPNDSNILLRQTRFSKINVVTQRHAIAVLKGPDTTLQRKAVEHIRSNPRFYTPPVLYVLADFLFKNGQRVEAMYWFYAAELRARYDANRSQDPSVQATIKAMNRVYGRDIQPYAHRNIDTLRQIVVAAIQFEQDTPHNYDHRWINLHGMQAARTAVAAQKGLSLNDQTPFSEPREKWPDIQQRTVKGFRVEMKRLFAHFEAFENAYRASLD